MSCLLNYFGCVFNKKRNSQKINRSRSFCYTLFLARHSFNSGEKQFSNGGTLEQFEARDQREKTRREFRVYATRKFSTFRFAKKTLNVIFIRRALAGAGKTKSGRLLVQRWETRRTPRRAEIKDNETRSGGSVGTARQHLRANIRAYIFRDAESTDEFPSDLTRKQMSSVAEDGAGRWRIGAQRKQNNEWMEKRREKERQGWLEGQIENGGGRKLLVEHDSFLLLRPTSSCSVEKLRGTRARSRRFSFS